MNVTIETKPRFIAHPTCELCPEESGSRPADYVVEVWVEIDGHGKCVPWHVCTLHAEELRKLPDRAKQVPE